MNSWASSVTEDPSGRRTSNLCKKVTKKMKNSIRAKLSPGQALLPTNNNEHSEGCCKTEKGRRVECALICGWGLANLKKEAWNWHYLLAAWLAALRSIKLLVSKYKEAFSKLAFENYQALHQGISLPSYNHHNSTSLFTDFTKVCIIPASNHQITWNVFSNRVIYDVIDYCFLKMP